LILIPLRIRLTVRDSRYLPKEKNIILAMQVTIEELLLIIKKQQALIEQLQAKVSSLEYELAIIKNLKNSNNSHMPPSKDENRPARNQSLRKSSGKKPGGQPGHEGKTLEFSTKVNKVIQHIPAFCNCCGKDLSGVPEVMSEKRQVIDIPPIKTEYIEHQVFSKTCSCGHLTQSQFPQEVKSSVQYGSKVEALIAYMYARHYLPFNRMKEFFSDVMGLPVSDGGIYHILQRFTQKSLPVYLQIKERIQDADFLGTDETGVKVNGKKHWFWTWQNNKLTFIVHSDNRGFATINNTFENGLPNAILQHDRWASHFQCVAKHHQICMAHILRDLNYIHELYHCDWSARLKALVTGAISLKNKLTSDDYSTINTDRENFEKNLGIVK
jgi:transposase